jgi:release factor glutamine methyltransferase
MNSREARQHLFRQLLPIYEEGEAMAVSSSVMEHLTGIDRNSSSYQQEKPLTGDQQDKLQEILRRLLKKEPLQYVLNEAWFCGLKFYVDKNVLIPRPETEELVEWVISNCKFPLDSLTILDIGTGSGCIPIALKRRLRKAEVWSCDSSAAALKIAQLNADNLGVALHFLLLDFLDPGQRKQLPCIDLLVSNPPYVPVSESHSLEAHVRDYEPAAALFVPDQDPLLFYRQLALFGKEKLNPGGSVYAEIHKDMGKAAIELFSEQGFNVELKKDMQGNDRMIRAQLK